MLTETPASDAIADLADELGQPCWRDLIEKDDRTSPEEYPDHALISQDELIEYIKVSLDMARDPKALPRAMWQPIETAPRDGTNVLLGCATWDRPELGQCGVETAAWFTDGGTYEDGDVATAPDEVDSPTHWQPLPANPA